MSEDNSYGHHCQLRKSIFKHLNSLKSSHHHTHQNSTPEILFTVTIKCLYEGMDERFSFVKNAASVELFHGTSIAFHCGPSIKTEGEPRQEHCSNLCTNASGIHIHFDSHCLKDCDKDQVLPLESLETCVSRNSDPNGITVEIKFPVTIPRLLRSLSAPNLTIDCDSTEQIINSDIATDTFNTSHHTRDEISHHRTKYFHDNIILRIDCDNVKSCAKDSDRDADKVATSCSPYSLFSPSSINTVRINAFASASFCQHYDTDEKSINDFASYRETSATIDLSGSVRRSIEKVKVKTPEKEKLYHNNNNNNKMDSVPLHDFFNDESHNGSPQCSPLLQRRSISASRYSRRQLPEKRLRNVFIDRLKKLARSQSQGRSDGSCSSTNLTSRTLMVRTKGLYRNVKRRFSSPHHFVDEEMRTVNTDDPCSAVTNTITNEIINSDSMTSSESVEANVLLRHCSSLESFQSVDDSGCGSSIQTNSLSTDSNRSSICNGDEVNSMSVLFRGPFISCARAINDCTPCPYDRDALSFKKGDIINIINKNDSGTWIGMTNGKIGHFKFINVEEMRSIGKCNKTIIKFNSIPSSTETEIQVKCSNESQFNTSIYDELKSQLNESDGAMTLSDVLRILGLNDRGYLSLFALNGFQDMDSFKEIGHADTLNALGITNHEHQHVLLNAAAIIRVHSDHKFKILSLDTSHSHSAFFWNRNDFAVAQSAPVTPAVDFNQDFADIFAKFNCLSTSSLNEYDEIQHYAKISQNISRINSQSNGEFCDLSEFADDKCKYDDDDKCKYDADECFKNKRVNGPEGADVNENNKVTLCMNDDTKQNEDSLNYANLRYKKDTTISGSNESHNGVSLSTSRDESMDRKLLRKLDIKPIYSINKKSSDSIHGIVASQSVLDLRANANIYKSTSERLFNSKKRMKKLAQNNRKSCSTLITSCENIHSLNTSNSSKHISPSLLEAILKQLKIENIDLTSQPYSDSAGFCGIPPALVQRYADESQKDVYELAEAIDHLRMQELQKINRRGVPNDYLGDSCNSPATDLANYENVHLWLVSLGLPMYESVILSAGFTDLYRISKLREMDLVNKCGIHEPRHIRALTNAIGALHLNLKETDRTENIY